MHVFDASSIIHAWDNYPILQFPGLWDWLASKITEGEIVIPSVALEEVEHKYEDCAAWLKDNEIEKVSMTNAIVQEAIRIKTLIGVAGDKYHPKGVDENDILIISTALTHRADLVSNEGRRPRPDILAKNKIPAVCDMPEVSVSCINFLEYIKSSEAIFR
jgi:predicted nucleic acid-binding protein